MPRPCMKCPKCRELRPMTLHHVMPRRWFGKKNNNLTFYLCRRCHDALELLIPFEKQPQTQYIRVLLQFLEDTS